MWGGFVPRAVEGVSASVPWSKNESTVTPYASAIRMRASARGEERPDSAFWIVPRETPAAFAAARWLRPACSRACRSRSEESDRLLMAQKTRPVKICCQVTGPGYLCGAVGPRFLGSVAVAEKTFRTRIVELRAEEGDLSQEGLARALGVSKGTVQGWESGAALPRGTTLVTLAEKFPRWSVDYLLGLTDVRERVTAPDEAAASGRLVERERGLREAEALDRPKPKPRRSKQAG